MPKIFWMPSLLVTPLLRETAYIFQKLKARRSLGF